MEMSMHMSSTPGNGSQPLPDAGAIAAAAAAAGISITQPVVAAVVPLSQVSDLQAVMAGQQAPPDAFSDQQYGSMPISQANIVMMSDADAYIGAGDGLVSPDGMLPRHPPGDVTPSSVTSSRAGLHWNIPSRGSMPPSPGKVDGGYGSRGDPRCVAYGQGCDSNNHRIPEVPCMLCIAEVSPTCSLFYRSMRMPHLYIGLLLNKQKQVSCWV
jgi:hypothetical protein